MDKSCPDEEEACDVKLFDQCFEFTRKQGINVRDFIAEANLRFSEARTAGLDLGAVGRS